jgi:hypothetical protein
MTLYGFPDPERIKQAKLQTYDALMQQGLPVPPDLKQEVESWENDAKEELDD